MLMIVDLGIGNVNSVQRALEYLSVPNFTSSDPADLKMADKIIFPGVGSFAEASKRLDQSGFRPALKKKVEENTPLLGICLGMQLLALEGEEGGRAPGLGFIDARVVRLRAEQEGFRLPHVGWNSLCLPDRPLRLFEGIKPQECFYFTHSYEMMISPDSGAVFAVTNYGVDFAAAVELNTVYGVQFHPEKSQKPGLQLLKNFASLT
jgi:glutamine amidotransferase